MAIAFTKKRMIGILIAVIGIAWLYHFFIRSTKQPPILAVSVTTQSAIQKDITIKTHAIGSVQPFVTVAVKSRVDGELLTIGFKEGDVVQENQVILQIDPRPFQVALDQAKATLARDQAQLDNYQSILTRYTSLTRKGFVSKQDYDQANANVKAQAALVLADQAAISNAKLNLDYCTIRAPISGRTGSLLINQGNLIKATDTNPLVVINKITPIYINFSLPQQQLAPVIQEMHQGTVPVTIHMKDPVKIVQAELSFIDNTVDTTTGMIQLKAVYPNEHEELWPGLYVDVTLPLYDLKNAIIIPTRAIQAGPEGTFVFVVNANSHVSKKLIKTGPAINSSTVVEGIQSETQVVVTGQTQLIDGSLVRVATSETEA